MSVPLGFDANSILSFGVIPNACSSGNDSNAAYVLFSFSMLFIYSFLKHPSCMSTKELMMSKAILGEEFLLLYLTEDWHVT